ncbi:MAG: methionyl-tRNA formyltransferase [Candidatus Omnitrophota bacterium]
MKVVFFGTDRFGIPCLERLIASRHQLIRVVTTPETLKGRHRLSTPSEVKVWAIAHGLEPLLMQKKPSPESLSALSQLQADVFLVASFGVILPRSILEMPKTAAINAHPSLLPKYRGPSPVPAALLAGDTVTGVSIIRITERLDAGDVMLRRELPIDPQEDGDTLERRLAGASADMALEALDLLESNKAVFCSQDEALATYAPKIKKESGRIDWTRPALELVNRVRAMRPWPGSFCFYKGKRLIVLKARVLEGRPLPPGTVCGQILEAASGGELIAAAADEAILMELVQREGKKPLTCAEFLKGFHVDAGSRFD